MNRELVCALVSLVTGFLAVIGLGFMILFIAAWLNRKWEQPK